MWVTLPFAALQLAGATFHRWAAAATSIARAAAPPLRKGVQKARTELELPVAWMPKTGLPVGNALSLAGACSSTTWEKSASSSSARIMATAV